MPEQIANFPMRGWSVPYAHLDAPIADASGTRIRTLTGKEYIDLASCYGSVILGHAHAQVTAAVVSVVERGAQCGGHHTAKLVAEQLANDVPLNDGRVAFFKTGTEAVRAAVGACRLATGRRLVISAGYHGWDTSWIRPVNSPRRNDEDVLDCFYVSSFLDQALRSTERAAAFVISPEYIHLDHKILRELIDTARKHGIPIISDEVKQGYRRCRGPSISRIGAEADIYVYSKAIANGWPISAVVGRPEFLKHLEPRVSTLTFEGSSMAAALATLRLLTPELYANFEAVADSLFAKLSDSLAASSLPISIYGDPFVFQFVCGDDALETGFYDACLRRGLVMFPRDAQTISAAFESSDVDEVINRFNTALACVIASFSDRVGQPVGPGRRRIAAFREMEGIFEPQDPMDAQQALGELIR